MSPRTWLIAILLLGGPAVLGSYAYGFIARPSDVGVLWGGVPEDVRGAYAAWMPIAAIGFLVFTYHIVFRIDPREIRVGPWGFGVFPLLYAAVLIGSALWMPLCFVMLDAADGRTAWLAIRCALWAVGLASAALIISLIALRPGEASDRRFPILAASCFSVQTLVLDALVWPALHPGP